MTSVRDVRMETRVSAPSVILYSSTSSTTTWPVLRVVHLSTMPRLTPTFVNSVLQGAIVVVMASRSTVYPVRLANSTTMVSVSPPVL